MPSLAQGYGRGLLLGLQLEETKRRKQRDELSDEFLRERIADIHWTREKEKKSLLAQIKAEEETAKQEKLITDIATMDALGRMPGESFMKSLLTGEQTPPETKERLTSIMDYVPGLSSEEQFKRIRVGEKVEGAPGAIPWGVSEIEESEIPRAARMALGLEPKAEKPKLPTIDIDIKKLEEELGGAKFIPSGAIVEVPEGVEAPGVLGSLNLADFGRREVGEVPEISLPRQPAPLETELPETLTGELQGFESFDEWYDSLPADAQEELEQEPETLRMIRDWYAVSR